MASMWQRTLYYLGLVDEGNAGDNAATEANQAAQAPSQAEVRTVEPETRVIGAPGRVPGRRVEPPATSLRRMSPDRAHAEAGVYMAGSDGRSVGTTGRFGEADVILARAFSDAQLLADALKIGRPVVMDLRGTEPEMVRRLVDFSSGLTYALDGTMRKVGQGVILVAPSGVDLSRDELRRLADLGLYDAADQS